MLTCRIVGCDCAGENAWVASGTHWPQKAYKGGYIYYAASYGERYGDPMGTWVSLVPGKAEEMADKDADEWREEMPLSCDSGKKDCQCPLCEPDIVVWGESSYAAKDLFTGRELMECRRDLLRGEAVYLPRY